MSTLSPFSRIRPALADCFLVLIALLAPCAALPQELPEPSAAPPAPALQSPGDAAEALADVTNLTASLADETVIDALRQRVAVAEDRFGTEIEVRLSTIPLDRIDRSRLDGVLLALSRQRSALAALRRDVSETIARIDSVLESLRLAESSWTPLVEDADPVTLAEEVVALIDRIVAAARTGQQLAGDRLGELVAIEARAIELDGRLSAVAADAEARARALLADIFRRDTGPLGPALASLSAGAAAADIASLNETLRYALIDLADAYGNRLLGQAAAGIAVLVLLMLLRGNMPLTSRIEGSAAGRVLDHPIATTLVLTLALTQPLYPTALPPVVALNTALFVGAELVVLGAALQRIGWAKLALVGAYLIATRVAYLLPFGTALHRLAMLIGALGGIALLVATWRFGAAQVGFGRWRAPVRLLLITFAALLAASVVANVIGALTFTSFVVEAVIRCYLAALGLFAISLVLRDLVVVLLDASPLGSLRSIQLSRTSITSLLRSAISVLAVLLWLWAALSAFGLLEPILEVLRRMLAASWTIGEATISLGTILVFVVSVWLAVYVSRMTRFFLDEDVLPRLDLPRGVPAAISTGAHYLIIAAALLFGTAAAGLDFTKIAIVVGALSVGIGFGLQNIVNNFISGLILLFERPIQVGDHVQVGQLMGRVTRIGIRASIVRMYEGSEVIVPNGDLISQQVVNHTLSDRNRRLELVVGVAYGTDLEQARAVIGDAVTSVELVSAEPPPQIFFRNFGDSSIDFRVLFWIDDFDVGLQTISDVGIAIERALARAGIEIPFPQRDLHLRSSVTLDRSAVEPDGRLSG